MSVFFCRLIVASSVVLAVHYTVDAEELPLLITDGASRPLAGVVLGQTGLGGPTAPSQTDGKTRLSLIQVIPGQTVPLYIVEILNSSIDYVFLKPWEGRLVVERPDDQNNFSAWIMLVERGIRDILNNPKVIRAILEQMQGQPLSTGITVAPQETKADLFRKLSAYFSLQSTDIESAIQSFAERAEDPYDKGLVALYEGRFPDADALLIKSLEAREARATLSLSEAHDAGFYLGRSYFEQGRYADAATAYKTALKYVPNAPTTLNDLAVSYAQAGRYNDALPPMTDALQITESAFGVSQLEYVNQANNQASILFELGRYQEAERLFEQVITIAQNEDLEARRYLATSLLGLAATYKYLDRNHEALPLAENAVEVLKEVFGEHHSEYAGGRADLADILSRMDRSEEALVILQETVETLTRLGAEKNRDYVATLNNLALVYQDLGHYSDAFDVSKECIEIASKIFAADHPKYAIVLNTHARSLFYTKKKLGATALFSKALQIVVKIFPDDHPHVLGTAHHLSLSLKSIGFEVEPDKLIQDYRSATHRE